MINSGVHLASFEGKGYDVERANLWALFVNFKEIARRGHISWEFFANSKKSARRGPF